MTGLTLARGADERLALRARMVLLAAGGGTTRQIARTLGTSEPTVRRWLGRFRASGVSGLRDAPRSGRPARAGRTAAAVISRRLLSPPPGGGRWTLRSLAREAGLATSTVHRVCRERGIRW